MLLRGAHILPTLGGTWAAIAVRPPASPQTVPQRPSLTPSPAPAQGPHSAYVADDVEVARALLADQARLENPSSAISNRARAAGRRPNVVFLLDDGAAAEAGVVPSRNADGTGGGEEKRSRRLGQARDSKIAALYRRLGARSMAEAVKEDARPLGVPRSVEVHRLQARARRAVQRWVHAFAGHSRRAGVRGSRAALPARAHVTADGR